MKLLTPLFNQEILRVAIDEKKTDEDSIKDLLIEIAKLCGVTLRAVYHWRSGRHALPSDVVPILCKRFGSNALLDELNRLRAQIEIEVPGQYDLAKMAARSVQEDMNFIEQILIAFESEGIQPGERDRLRELAARAHGNLHRLMEIAEADCARRLEIEDMPRKGNKPAAKADSKFQITERKQVVR
jgi:hypothetical protein